MNSFTILTILTLIVACLTFGSCQYESEGSEGPSCGGEYCRDDDYCENVCRFCGGRSGYCSYDNSCECYQGYQRYDAPERSYAEQGYHYRPDY